MNNQPNIAKATALSYIGNYPSKQTYTTTLQMLANSDSDIRLSALQALESFPPELRFEHTFKMLDDKSKVVRIEAARQLSGTAIDDLDAQSKAKLEKGINEYKQSLIFNADRAESQTALGSLYANLGDAKKAEEAFKEALRIQPSYVPATANYVYFLQANNRDDEALALLQDGIKRDNKQASLYYVLGLWQVRHHESTKALASLKRAADLDKDNTQFQYAYAVALGEKDIKTAIKILEDSLKKHTGDIQTLYGLSYYYQQIGQDEKAKAYQKRADALRSFVPKIQQ
jgi:tetratricopeptide (TPR) repeat protein